MSENESKFTNEYILKAFNCAVFLDEPACTEMREALNEMMGLKQRIATLEASLRWIPVSERLPLPNQRVDVQIYGQAYKGYYVHCESRWVVGEFIHSPSVTCWRETPELPTPEVKQ